MASFLASGATLTLPCSLSRLFATTFLLALGSTVNAQTATAHFSGAQNTILTVQPSDAAGGIAVDALGNLYVASLAGHTLLKESLSGDVYTESTIPISFVEDFAGLAVDTLGNLYVADNVPAGVLKETLSGGGYIESTIPFGDLEDPSGIAVDGSGNVYLADLFQDQVFKATPSGNKYLLSRVPSSGLSSPNAVAVDTAGNVYVSDSVNHRVVREAASGSKNTQSVVVDLGSGGRPFGVAVDARDNVYVLMNHGEEIDVVKETPTGGGYTQSAAVMTGTVGGGAIAADAGGNLFLSQAGNQVEKLQLPSANFGAVNVGSTSASTSLVFTFDTAGKVNLPVVVTLGSVGLDFADAGTGSCTTNGKTHAYKVGETCTIDVIFKPRYAGARYGAGLLRDDFGHVLASGYVYGMGLGAQAAFFPGTGVSIANGLVNPLGVAVDGSGSVYVAESGTGTVYKETLAGGVSTRTAIAGGLSQPTGVALDGWANVYIAAADGVYKETPSGGSYSQSKIVTDLTDVVGIAVDGSGNVATVSSASGDVHLAALQGNGSYMESAIGSGISNPSGVAVDGNGNIYVCDARSGDVYAETLQVNGSYVQTTIGSGLTGAESIAVAGGGNLYITGSSSGMVYMEAPKGDGTYVQTVAASGLTVPWGIAVDGRGNLYLSQDTLKGDLAMIDVADAPSLSFSKTDVGSTSPDSPQTVTVSNMGNAALGFPVPASGTNPNLTTNFSLGAETTCPEVSFSGTAGSLGAGSSCVYAIDFTPVSRGSITGSLAITDTNRNAAAPGYAEQSVALSGTGLTSDATRTTMRVSPNPVAVGLGVTITATVLDTTTAATVPTGSVTFTDSVGGVLVSLNGGVPVPLSEGKATLTMIPNVAGTHTITAHYGGVDASFAGSTGQASLMVQ